MISKAELAKHVQLVLTDRSELTRGREFGVMSPLTWRLSDLFSRRILSRSCCLVYVSDVLSTSAADLTLAVVACKK